MEKETYWNILQYVKSEAAKIKDTYILDWLKSKEGMNRWSLECLSWATTEMKRDDWFSTSFSMNIAESAHAYSQREGTRLSLVSTVQKARLLDQRYFEAKVAANQSGIHNRYGSNTTMKRTSQNLKRNKKASESRKKLDPRTQAKKDTIEKAQELIRMGVSAEVVEVFLKTETKKAEETME